MGADQMADVCGGLGQQQEAAEYSGHTEVPLGPEQSQNHY